MRIKKVSQTTPVQAQIVDGYSTSTTDGYSANYVNDALFFKSGDTHTTGNNYGGGIGGLITSSKTNLCFDIIVPKSLKNISSVSITGLRVRARSVEGTYLITSGGGTGYADLITNQDSTGTALAQSCTNITANIITDNQIRIQATFNSAIYTTNNVPVAVEYRNLAITFS